MQNSWIEEQSGTAALRLIVLRGMLPRIKAYYGDHSDVTGRQLRAVVNGMSDLFQHPGSQIRDFEWSWVVHELGLSL